MSRTIEIERTYDPADLPVPDLRAGAVATVDDPQTVHLEAVYHDTADLRLAASRATLRRRTGGLDDGWHLKLPASGDARTELQRALGRGTRPPVSLVRIVTALTRGAPLVPVVRLETRRVLRVLRDVDGTGIAEVVDDEVRATRLDRTDLEPLVWRELEVELTGEQDVDDGVLDDVEGALVTAGIGRSSAGSKLRRALGADAPSTLPPASGLGRKRAGSVLHRYLVDTHAAFVEADLAVRLGDAGVHHVRTNARRLRTAVTVHRALLDEDLARTLQRELRWIGHELGPVRELEVLEPRLLALISTESPAEGGAAATLATRTELRAAYREAMDAAHAALTSPRYTALLDDLHRLVHEPPWTTEAERKASRVLPALAARQLQRVGRRMADVDDAADSAARWVALHDVRKAAKRARYTFEVGEPVVPGADRLRKRASAVQTDLGDVNDAADLQRLIARVGDAAEGTGDQRVGFVLGRLYERQGHTVDELGRSHPRLVDRLLGDRAARALRRLR